jgi:dipeptidyl aminopeptidase/acylaminoacyl peptidase
MKKWLFFVALLFCVHSSIAQKRAMTVEDMWAMKRISEIALSPDGKQIAFSLAEYDMKKNSSSAGIWLIPSEGGEPVRLTQGAGKNIKPRWKPDGSGITFLSTRNGSSQIYSLSLSGGEAQQLTDFPVDVEDFCWSPNGRRMAFVAKVLPGAKTLQESADQVKAEADSPVQAKIIDGLLYRHWDSWLDGKRNHIFLCDPNGQNVQQVTAGDFDAPPVALESNYDFSFSPDGGQIAYVSNHDKMVAASTNNDVFITPVVSIEDSCITSDNAALDSYPVFSPGGRYIAYRAMKRAGFEADQYELILYDRRTGEKKSLTDLFDRDVDEIVWTPDSKKVIFNAEDEGRVRIFVLDIRTQTVDTLVRDHINTNILINPDGRFLYFRRQAVNLPYEIFRFDLRKKALEQLTFINKPLLDELALNEAEYFWFTSFDGQKEQGIMVKPPFFDPAKEYPLIYLIHGGPQNMWSDDFHYRWNINMFAAPGYIAVAVNFRGSKGYGQNFCDAVSRDWGGSPYKDLMAGLDYLLATYPFIDENRIGAAGASYGGYMINWIATQTDRFKALVCHAGSFDLPSEYGATEELWFPEWEFDGTPYEHPELYEKWSPLNYAKNMKNFKTPTLVIHCQGDFRVPVTEGFQMFTALQRMGVPSRLIYFPDEGHWVLKPQNARLWWKEVFAWLDKWLNP